ncbi:ABC transporter permease [Fulvivirgaceae bacterium BMA12]|uniref:ABC transporter permease n=1 Tax=Agaribacillus aureus TaxID=3051825 RepID=A0ABT8LHF5_9BACT|nr:ABC transporter permease [Fulvivirgaceae bacterium BMA12]
MNHKRDQHPPRFADRFLRWFCSEEVLETLQGDLYELYFQRRKKLGKFSADLHFVLDVLDTCRPFALRQKSGRRFFNSNIMFKNHMKLAWRNLKSQPFFTFLNMTGLAVGMAGGLLIALFIYDELSFDKMFADSDRIYRVNIDMRNSGETNYYAAVSGPLAGVIRQDCPHVEMVTRFRVVQRTLLRKVEGDENVKENHVIGVDSTFFDMFGLELLVGDKETALKEPNTLILTRSAAEKHFKLNEALGQSLLLNNTHPYTVTGVIDDFPKNSFLRDHSVFIALESFDNAHSDAWNNFNFPTFVKLAPTAQIDDFQKFLTGVNENYLIPWAMTFVPGLTVESAKADDKKTGNFMKFRSIALEDIHLYSRDRQDEFSPNSDIEDVYILSLIGFFLVLLAIVNFMNLSTACALKRAREVGVRKTLGANRYGLIRQFLTESALISSLSFLMAVLIAYLAMPFFNELTGKNLEMPFYNPIFWLAIVAAAIILSIFSGSYPAFFMSRFMPVKVLKGSDGNSSGNGRVRNYLVVFQFSISVFLIVSTLVVFQQLSYIQSKDLGFQKDQILVVDDVYAAGNQMRSLKQQLLDLGEVRNVSLSSYLPTPSDRSGTTFFLKGSFKAENAFIVGHWEIDCDYIPTLDLEIVAGRNFSEEFYTDSSGVILNESAVAMLGVNPGEAIGLQLTRDFHRQDKEHMKFMKVIGVVKNFHFESLRNDIGALSLVLGGGANRMMVKLQTKDFSNTVKQIRKIWEKVAPHQPFNYYFLDESFNSTYKAEQRLGRIFITFTILSLFIACLGLFGLAAFNADKRVKEIGIRKVLGASVSQITYRLSADFLRLVVIAVFISIPLGWYVMNRWLEDFSYRIEISWWIFVLAAALAIAISIVTVSYQSIKAAMASPVKSLRSE